MTKQVKTFLYKPRRGKPKSCKYSKYSGEKKYKRKERGLKVRLKHVFRGTLSLP